MSHTFSFESWRYVPRIQRWEWRSLGLAFIMHSILFAGLILHLDWHSQQTQTVEAELWSSLPVVAGRPAPPPEPEPASKPKPVTPPAFAQTNITPEIAIADKKLPKPAIENKPIEKKPEPKKPETSPDRQAEQVREKLRQQELDRLFGKADANAKGSDANSPASRSQGRNDSDYAGQIRMCIRPHISKPVTLSGNPEVVYRIELLPDGTQSADPKLIKSSGQRAWDEAVERAIKRCDVLPRPKQGTIPRNIEIGFRPLEENG